MVMDPVNRVSASSLAGATVLSVTNIDDPSTELNARAGGTNGALCIVTQNVAGINSWTIYCFDSASSGTVNTPYVVAALTSGQWIAVAGKYVNGQHLIASAGSTILRLTNTNASASNAGALLTVASDGGAAMNSGDRLGGVSFVGATDAAHTLSNTCRFEAFATEAWSATNRGTQLTLKLAPNGSTVAVAVATWDQDRSLTCTGTIIAPAGTTAIASMRVPHGAAPSSPTNGDIWTTTAGLFVRINGATVGPLT